MFLLEGSKTSRSAPVKATSGTDQLAPVLEKQGAERV